MKKDQNNSLNTAIAGLSPYPLPPRALCVKDFVFVPDAICRIAASISTMSNSFSTRSVVAMGFGFYGTVELLTTTTFADVGTTFKFMWGVISIAAYSIAVLIWIWYFWIPARVTDPELRTLGPALR